MSGDLTHLSFRALGYISANGLWAAHCLETDLVGYGRSFKKALENLIELTEMQISFAFQTEQMSLLDHPAPPRIFDLYNTMFRAILLSAPKRKRVKEDYKIRSFPFPANPDLRDRFVQTQAI
ncbi:MAG: hypothetical protein ABIK83_10810 [Candidatus Zixiibacteriota bacterium]